MIIPAVAGVIALLFVAYLSMDILRKNPGNEKMVQISKLVQEGAKAFLRREYTYVSIFVIAIAALIAIAPMISEVQLGWKTSIAFMIGSVVSALAGYIGMSIATRANSRTAQGAIDDGLKGALSIAVSGGAVMGMSVVGLALLGLVAVYIVFKGDPTIVNGYAMGASLVALFARSGGGIFTKGADMGADLVGKVEANIPEDDPRNPAVIADNVGDNVGDVAGLGADLLESYVESMIASIAIAAGLGIVTLQMLPLQIASAGIVASIIGVLYVKFAARNNPQKALMNGTYISAILTAVATFLIVKYNGVEFTDESGTTYGVLGPFWATLAGVISGIIVGLTSEFYTSSDYKPVRRLAEESQSGPALTVTGGISLGMASTAIPVIVLAIAVLVSVKFAGIYGVAMAAFGMLATTGMVVSVDSYGPIADNAGGIAEMAQLDPNVRKITDNLDAVGNTTAAIGKGFAIGSAAFAAMGLLVAYMHSVELEAADIKDPYVLVGLILGGMLPYFFSSMLFQAVSKAAFKMIEEVRRQFREIKGLMEGTALPDSARCVDISTKGAINGMLVPGIMAILAPVVVGLVLGKAALAGLLVGALVSGLVLGIQMANSGGAMDNAKKYIEEGHFGGKGSETHKAAVIGDTVGDPLKDTVGPSINILIKLMSVISLVLAPLFK
ncbi:MAG: sodium-translocating pyrophosphatase [candidate division KSB1 bacterium]|nr:sodium-translocating pyrophosphatase [candidate division KSB1 bacterium]MDQ7066155.1 sodium-translocating pyrophosphatase [candidate division KSB1 bacterium]